MFSSYCEEEQLELCCLSQVFHSALAVFSQKYYTAIDADKMLLIVATASMVTICNML